MIIFLYGEDTYRSSQKLEKIKNKFQKEVDSSGMNLTVLDGAGLKFEEFNQQVKASPFLARKRMVIIKNLISDNKSKNIQKEIVELLNHESKQPDQNNIIIFWEATNHSKSRTKNALWDRLIKEKFAEEFKPLSTGQLNAWIDKEIKKRQAQIEKTAITKLAAMVGNDLWQLTSEIEKLVNYCQTKQITPTEIEKLVKAKYDDDIFKLIDSLGNKNKKQALKLISDQINSGANEIYLLSMLIRQFKILLLIKDLQNNNQSLTKDQIAKELKIHPFVAQKALSQAQNFTLNQLKNIYQLLLNIDLQIKTSSTKPKLLFDLFIAQI
ncbi:MAG: DNA polymerase III subunit delta [Candidatus Buchananbacteria bacterium]|nr:DNA polymerase III subunit delta [Candidatus Buchananbacteria bacterium]